MPWGQDPQTVGEGSVIPRLPERHITLKAQEPWEGRRSRAHVGTRRKAVHISQQLLFLLLWDGGLPLRARGDVDASRY